MSALLTESRNKAALRQMKQIRVVGIVTDTVCTESPFVA